MLCTYMSLYYIYVMYMIRCRNCEDNDAIYKAMNLTNLFDIHNDIINFTEVSKH